MNCDALCTGALLVNWIWDRLSKGCLGLYYLVKKEESGDSGKKGKNSWTNISCFKE